MGKFLWALRHEKVYKRSEFLYTSLSIVIVNIFLLCDTQGKSQINYPSFARFAKGALPKQRPSAEKCQR